jgi:hypothetical protein
MDPLNLIKTRRRYVSDFSQLESSYILHALRTQMSMQKAYMNMSPRRRNFTSPFLAVRISHRLFF